MKGITAAVVTACLVAAACAFPSYGSGGNPADRSGTSAYGGEAPRNYTYTDKTKVYRAPHFSFGCPSSWKAGSGKSGGDDCYEIVCVPEDAEVSAGDTHSPVLTIGYSKGKPDGDALRERWKDAVSEDLTGDADKTPLFMVFDGVPFFGYRAEYSVMSGDESWKTDEIYLMADIGGGMLYVDAHCPAEESPGDADLILAQSMKKFGLDETCRRDTEPFREFAVTSPVDISYDVMSDGNVIVQTHDLVQETFPVTADDFSDLQFIFSFEGVDHLGDAEENPDAWKCVWYDDTGDIVDVFAWMKDEDPETERLSGLLEGIWMNGGT